MPDDGTNDNDADIVQRITGDMDQDTQNAQVDFALVAGDLHCVMPMALMRRLHLYVRSQIMAQLFEASFSLPLFPMTLPSVPLDSHHAHALN